MSHSYANFEALLTGPNTAVLTTLSGDGSPNSSPVWFWFDGADVYVSTTDDRAKYHNVLRDPRVSFTVFDPQKPLRYIEVRGIVVIDSDPDYEMRDRIAAKHGIDDPGMFDAPGAKRVTLRIEPTKVIEH